MFILKIIVFCLFTSCEGGTDESRGNESLICFYSFGGNEYSVKVTADLSEIKNKLLPEKDVKYYKLSFVVNGETIQEDDICQEITKIKATVPQDEWPLIQFKVSFAWGNIIADTKFQSRDRNWDSITLPDEFSFNSLSTENQIRLLLLLNNKSERTEGTHTEILRNFKPEQVGPIDVTGYIPFECPFKDYGSSSTYLTVCKEDQNVHSIYFYEVPKRGGEFFSRDSKSYIRLLEFIPGPDLLVNFSQEALLWFSGALKRAIYDLDGQNEQELDFISHNRQIDIDRIKAQLSARLGIDSKYIDFYVRSKNGEITKVLPEGWGMWAFVLPYAAFNHEGFRYGVNLPARKREDFPARKREELLEEWEGWSDEEGLERSETSSEDHDWVFGI